MTDKPKEIDKQLVFAEEYINSNRNATLAYKKVYGQTLSDEVAAVNASKLLRITKVKIYLQRRFDVLELNSDYVLKNLKYLAESSRNENVRLNANIWIGKSIGMFNDNYIQQIQIQEDPEERARKEEETKERIKKVFSRFLSGPEIIEVEEQVRIKKEKQALSSLNQ